jgi:cysteine-rich repeat protein
MHHMVNTPHPCDDPDSVPDLECPPLQNVPFLKRNLCYQCKDGWVVAPDGLSCQTPASGFHELKKCRIFADQNRNKCAECLPDAEAVETNTACKVFKHIACDGNWQHPSSAEIEAMPPRHQLNQARVNCCERFIPDILFHVHRCDTCVEPDDIYINPNEDPYHPDIINLNGTCTDRCGDAKRYTKELLPGLDKYIECDDGNTVNGDGCTDQCELEHNWICYNGTHYRPDECTHTEPLMSKVHNINNTKRIIEITFNDFIKVLPLTTNATPEDDENDWATGAADNSARRILRNRIVSQKAINNY